MIRQSNLKRKAATMLNRKPFQIELVEEHHNGATVHCKDGNHLNIPIQEWIGQAIE
jgi:hypothetical protein